MGNGPIIVLGEVAVSRAPRRRTSRMPAGARREIYVENVPEIQDRMAPSHRRGDIRAYHVAERGLGTRQ